MASPVPYDPTPQVAPTSQGIGPVHTQADPSMFGGLIGTAVEHLGQTLQTSGAELFDRAYAMQQINEQATASKVSSDYGDEVATKSSEYHTKLGNDAVQGLAPHIEDIETSRAKYREQLTSPLAQRAFDEQSRFMSSWAKRGGAGHAASEGKKYAMDQSQARIDQAQQAVFNAPADDEMLTNSLKTVEDEAKHKAAMLGASPEATQELVDVATSNTRVAKLEGLRRTDPVAAQKLLDRWTSTGVLPATSAANQIDKDAGIGTEPGEGGKVPFGVPYKPGSISVKSGADVRDLSPSAHNMLNGIIGAGIQPRVNAGFATSGHAPQGEHPKGNAIDFNVTGWSDDQKTALVQAAMQNGGKGFGIYPSGNTIHIDTRESPMAWGPNPAGMNRGASLEMFPPWAQKALSPLYEQGNRGGGLIRGDKVPEISYKIQQSLNTTGARKEASDLLNGGSLTWGEHATDINNMSEAIAGIESSNKWIGRHPSPPMSRDFALGRYGIMKSNLPEFLGKAGLDPNMTEEQFIADHGAQKKVFDTIFGGYLKEFNGNANLAAVKWFGGQGGVQAYLRGQSAGVNDGHTSVPGYLQQFNRNLAKGSSAADYQSVAQTRAQSLLPGNFEFQDAISNQLELLHRRQESIDRETELNNRLSVGESMLQPTQSGRLPETPDELSPEGKAAFEELNPVQQAKFLEVMNNNNRQGGQYLLTPESSAEMRQAVGVAQAVGTTHPPTPEAIEKFMDEDFSAKKWPAKDRMEMIQMQRRLLKQEEADPRMAHALQVLSPYFDEGGFDPKGDDTEKSQFIGDLHAMITSFQKTYAKPPSDADIKEMGKVLFARVTSPGKIFGNVWKSTDPAFKAEIPAEPARIIHDQWFQLKGYEPTVDEIRAVYLAQQYTKQFGKKATPASGTNAGTVVPKGSKAITTPGGSPTTPQVPVSP